MSTALVEPKDSATLRRVVGWLNRIGLPAEPGTRFDQSFARGVWFDEGRIVFDPNEAHPGDLLHEAGHLAVLPSRFRALVTGDIEESLHEALDAYMATVTNPDEPVARAILQSGDCEAIAWSYAAAVQCRIDPWLCFTRGFGDEDEAHAVFEQVRAGCYLGINGLRAAGFFARVRDFPRLVKWVQP